MLDEVGSDNQLAESVDNVVRTGEKKIGRLVGLGMGKSCKAWGLSARGPEQLYTRSFLANRLKIGRREEKLLVLEFLDCLDVSGFNDIGFYGKRRVKGTSVGVLAAVTDLTVVSCRWMM